jgi:hypothetical protein
VPSHGNWWKKDYLFYSQLRVLTIFFGHDQNFSNIHKTTRPKQKNVLNDNLIAKYQRFSQTVGQFM